LALLLLLISSGLRGQSGSTGEITGVIEDPTGAVIPNAQVVVINQGTGTTLARVVAMSRNTLRGPFQQNWDFSLIKSTKLTERMSFDFRAEFFNIFNHPSFTSPEAGIGNPLEAGAAGSFGNYGLVDISAGSAILQTANRPRVI
jgi:hypothetical protein